MQIRSLTCLSAGRVEKRPFGDRLGFRHARSSSAL